MSAIWTDCLDAVAATIRELALTGIHNSQVATREKPFGDNWIDPGVWVSPPNLDMGRGVNAATDKAYGCQVTWIRGSSQPRNESPERVLGVIQSIFDAFHDKRLTGVPSVYICKVEPLEVLLPKQHLDKWDAQGLIIKAWSRECRT